MLNSQQMYLRRSREWPETWESSVFFGRVLNLDSEQLKHEEPAFNQFHLDFDLFIKRIEQINLPDYPRVRVKMRSSSYSIYRLEQTYLFLLVRSTLCCTVCFMFIVKLTGYSLNAMDGVFHTVSIPI